jgi:hypothetical protein
MLIGYLAGKIKMPKKAFEEIEKEMKEKQDMDNLLVCVESPYAGNIERNTLYLKHCLTEVIKYYNENPYASHAFLVNCLDDSIEGERARGLVYSRQWGLKADKRIFYVDFEMSGGMVEAANYYISEDKLIEFRTLTKEYRDSFLKECKEKGIEL